MGRRDASEAMTTTSARQTRVPFMDLRRANAPLAVEFSDAFGRVLGASAFVLGEEVEAFEAEFAQACSALHCVGVASGTAALTITLIAAGIGPGDEVIVPGHTYIASALGVAHAGAEVVFCDVEEGTGLIDPNSARAAVGPRTAAVLAVHLYGQACNMEAIQAFAKPAGILVLEDAAQAHGARYCGHRAGSLGAAAAFSFYPSKNLGALGDGGAICTDDDVLAARVRRLR
ncbi:MAG: aminotransferase class V-fold PLP-dependent enzyme, partial [Solirubrobacterales bacterium]|nr:aminotransferase class V-fold PLP-dependent enzyme [Solirubrobacterales bacterium]